MRKGIPTKIIIVILVLCSIFPAVTGFAATAPSFSVSATPAGQSHKVGDTITFTVDGRDIKDMYAFEVALVFDPGVLEYKSSGVKLAGNGMPVSKVRDNNRVLFGFTRVGKVSGENGNKALCEIKFKVLAEENTTVKLDSVKIVQTNEASQNYTGNELNLRLGNGKDKDKDKVKLTISGADIKVDKNKGIAQASIGAVLLQESFNKALKDDKGVKTVEIIIPKVDGVKAYEQILPASFFKAAEPLKAVEISTDIAVITVPGNMLSESDMKGGADVSLTVAKGDKTKLGADAKAQIGDRTLIDLSLKVSGKPISWNSHTSAVTVSVAYKPTTAELKDTEHITVLYIDASNKLISVPNGRYNHETGMVTFKTNHFSKYAVAFVKKAFADLSGYSWASRQIGILASKGIITGTSGNKYSPSAKITRADFLAYLVRTLGLDAAVNSNFIDIRKTDYYYSEIGIAKKLGITTGTGNNKFSPKAPITRQDMMVMTARAMEIAGKLDLTGNTAVISKFTDKAKIASYAVDSVAVLVETGLITGSNNRINPIDNTTRAEIAVLMYRIYNME